MLTAAITPQQGATGFAAESGNGSPADGFAILLQALAGGQQQATAKGTATLLAPGDAAQAGSPEATTTAVDGTAAEGAATRSQTDVTQLLATAQQGDATQGAPMPAAEPHSAAPAAGAALAAQTIVPNPVTQGPATAATQAGEPQGQAGAAQPLDGPGAQQTTSQTPDEQQGHTPPPAIAPAPQSAASESPPANAATTANFDPVGAADPVEAAPRQLHEGDNAGNNQTHDAPPPVQAQAEAIALTENAASGDPNGAAATALASTVTNPVSASQTQIQTTPPRSAAQNSGAAIPPAPRPDAPKIPAATPAQALPDAEASELTGRPAPTQPATAKPLDQQAAKATGQAAATTQAPASSGAGANGARAEAPFADQLAAFRTWSALDPFGFTSTAPGANSAAQLASFMSEGAALTVQQAAAPSSVDLPAALGGRPAVADPGVQLAIQIHRAITANSQQFRIQLEPADLGRVDVRLYFGRDGRVRATIGVERAETLDLIQRDVQELERVLKQAGTDPNKLDLRFNLQGDSREQAGGEDAAGSSVGRDTSEAAADQDSTNLAEASARSQRIDGLLDMHV